MSIPPSIWLVDFEFHQPIGEVPRPICMVARNACSGETRSLWLWDETVSLPPIPLEADSVMVAYLASAELSCYLSLGWPLPRHVIDLYAEFRLLTSGRAAPAGHGLLGALIYFGLLGIDASEKEDLRAIAIRGGPFSNAEKSALLDYCESDVVALSELLRKMWPFLDLPRALIRGRYMAAVAKVERLGVPIDREALNQLRLKWDSIRLKLICRVDQLFGVYEGTTFKAGRLREYCERREIRWPLGDGGRLCLKSETFKQMAENYPEFRPLYELRASLGQMKMNELSVGLDGRNRYLCGVFRAKTGRNQPSSSRSIFGPARWVRFLIKPAPGMAVAYVDYSQQEFGIAAALSGDQAMMRAYQSGDPYLEFARMAGAVPESATKGSHPVERSQYKVAALGVLMGMGAETLGSQTNTSGAMGGRLLRQHREVFRRFWEWSDDQVDRAMLGEALLTVYGWRLHPFHDRPTTYRNFKLQANGADILRLAAIAITERGIGLCAMVHDAVLIEAPIDEIESAVAETRYLMAEASRAVLGGFEIGTEAEIIRFPDRFSDSRGREMWEIISNLAGLCSSNAPVNLTGDPIQIDQPMPFDHV